MTKAWLCPFGYWVGPRGEIESIDGWQQHAHAVEAIAEKYGLGNLASWWSLKDRGWIAISVDRNLATPSFYLHPELSEAQAGALLRICAAHHREDMIICINGEDHGDPIGWGRCIREGIET